ncbi:hypothetical protein D3C72_1671200 [compost metagenome]
MAAIFGPNVARPRKRDACWRVKVIVFASGGVVSGGGGTVSPGTAGSPGVTSAGGTAAVSGFCTAAVGVSPPPPPPQAVSKLRSVTASTRRKVGWRI